MKYNNTENVQFTWWHTVATLWKHKSKRKDTNRHLIVTIIKTEIGAISQLQSMAILCNNLSSPFVCIVSNVEQWLPFIILTFTSPQQRQQLRLAIASTFGHTGGAVSLWSTHLLSINLIFIQGESSGTCTLFLAQYQIPRHRYDKNAFNHGKIFFLLNATLKWTVW